MPVNTARADYQAMHDKWTRLRDCYGGRDTILKAGEKYVPSLPAKNVQENTDYRARGNFYNAVLRTVQGMVGAIFQEPPEVEFPEPINDYLDDITLTNVPFEMFAQDTGREVMLLGRSGVFVDMPLSLNLTNRPYCVRYAAEDIINWRTTRVFGRQMLTMVVLREKVDEINPKDPFVYDCTTQYRVLQLEGNVLADEGICTVQLWREKSKDDKTYVEYGSKFSLLRRGAALNFIPFVFMCAENATPDLEQPPLIDLADVNLSHWRNSVDHEYGAHLVALPTPWVAGAKSTGTTTEPMKIGPSVVWELDVQGSAGMLEFTGEGLGSLVAIMDEKKKQMAALGGRLLEDSAAVQETASAVRMRHAGEHASLRTVAQSIEMGFTLVLQIVAWWVGTDVVPSDTEVSVELNKEYLNIKASAQEIQAMLGALQANEISFDTWWKFMQDGGYGREGVDAQEEQDLTTQMKDAKQAAAVAIAEASRPVPVPPTSKKVVRDSNGLISEIQG